MCVRAGVRAGAGLHYHESSMTSLTCLTRPVLNGGYVVTDQPDDVRPSSIAADPAVPRSAQARRARKVCLVELARRLSVNPRTIYKWLARGAPAALDEATMREWARMNGIRGLRPALSIDVPRGSADAPGTEPATATTPGSAAAAKGRAAIAPPEGWSPAQQKAMADADLSESRRHKVRLEIAELERRLVGRDDLVAIAGALSLVYVHALVDLPAGTVRRCDQLPPEWRRAIRKAMEEEIEALRGNLEATLRAKLTAVLRGPGVARAG
jgi:hypothetical protein